MENSVSVAPPGLMAFDKSDSGGFRPRLYSVVPPGLVQHEITPATSLIDRLKLRFFIRVRRWRLVEHLIQKA